MMYHERWAGWIITYDIEDTHNFLCKNNLKADYKLFNLFYY